MASRRELKRDISYIIGDIFTECLIYKELVPGTDKQAADEIIIDLLRMDKDFIARISHTEPGKAKEYYRTLIKDFRNQISDAIGKLTKLKK